MPAVPSSYPRPRPGAPIVEPRAAATLVVLRRAAGGLQVLLTRRAANLRFGAGTWVFPGGGVDESDADPRAAAVREAAEEAGVEVDPSTLIPLTRWVTPPRMSSRFDARFFGAFAPPDTAARAASPEVAAVAWLGAADALEGHARGELPMWLPTFVTLQQLDGLPDEEAVRAAFRAGAAAPPDITVRGDVLRTVEQPWAGGVEGRRATGWIVGRREWVVVDPADTTIETISAIDEAARVAGARLAGVAIRDLRPERHAGVGMLATGLGLPVVAGPGAGAAPYPVAELSDGERIPFGDVPIVSRRATEAGARRWPGAMSLEVAGGVLPA